MKTLFGSEKIQQFTASSIATRSKARKLKIFLHTFPQPCLSICVLLSLLLLKHMFRDYFLLSGMLLFISTGVWDLLERRWNTVRMMTKITSQRTGKLLQRKSSSFPVLTNQWNAVRICFIMMRKRGNHLYWDKLFVFIYNKSAEVIDLRQFLGLFFTSLIESLSCSHCSCTSFFFMLMLTVYQC